MWAHYKSISPKVIQVASRRGGRITCIGSLAVGTKSIGCNAFTVLGSTRPYTAWNRRQLSKAENGGVNCAEYGPLVSECIERIQSEGKISLESGINEMIMEVITMIPEHEKHELLDSLKDTCRSLENGTLSQEVTKFLDLANSKRTHYNDPVLFRGLGTRHAGREFVNLGTTITKAYVLVALGLYQSLALKDAGLHKQITSLLVDLGCKSHLGWMLKNWPEHCAIPDLILQIKAFGIIGDHKSAYETLKLYLSSDDNNRLKVSEAHSSLIDAYFNCNERLSAMQYFERLLRERSGSNTSFELDQIVDSMVKGFANVDDFAAVWNWIKRSENDPKLPAVSIPILVDVLSHLCANNQLEVAGKLFDYMASRKDCLHFEEFNQARSDYLMLHIKNLHNTKTPRSGPRGSGGWPPGNLDNVQKVVKEVQLRFGILDHYTLLEVVEIIINEGYPDAALDLFQTQTIRLKNYIVKKGMNLDSFQHIHGFCILTVFEFLEQNNHLTHKTVVPLLSSGFISQCNKSDIWPILKQAESLPIPGTLAPEELMLFYARRVEFGEDSMRDNLVTCVCSVINNGIPIYNESLNEVKHVLSLIRLHELCDELTKKVKLCDPILEMSIKAYAETRDNAYKALRMFEEAILLRKAISSDAVISLVLNENKDVVSQVYGLAMDCDHLKTCVRLHQMVMHRGFQPIMNQAYQRLIDMGSCPDDTGYAELISQTSSVNKALSLYKEACSMKIVPNTTMVNTLLSKLTRKKRFIEAEEIYHKMEIGKIPKNNETYLTMLRVAYDTKDESLANSIFKDVDCSTTVPTIPLYNLMMQFYVHQQPDQKKALKLFDRIQNHPQIEPSAHTYQLLMEAYTLTEPVDIPAADQVLKMIVQDRLAINSRHYAALIRARGVVSKNLKAAQEFYDSLVFRSRVKPDASIFEALMESYVVNDQPRETLPLLQELVKYNIDINSSLANLLLKAWSTVDVNKTAELFHFLQTHKVTNPLSLELMIKAYINHGYLHEAKNLLASVEPNYLSSTTISTIKNSLQSATK
jgi:tetratricopeptide (TPR) repeat protein